MSFEEALAALLWILAGLLAVGLIKVSLRIPKQWERMALLRLGRFKGMRGPGPFLRIPLADHVAATVDTRTIVHDIAKQKTLTRDNVPVTVDAIVYFRIRDPERAILSVQFYPAAINGGAASMLRDSIGRRDLDDLLRKREEVGAELKRALDAMTSPWGIEVEHVAITELWMSPDLEEAMSREAAATRERRARAQLALAEKEIATTLLEAAKTYEADPVALNIRSMNMLYEMSMQGKGTTIFIPTETALQMRTPVGAFGMLGAIPKASGETGEGSGRADSAPPG